jgi:hypothetical protein
MLENGDSLGSTKPQARMAFPAFLAAAKAKTYLSFQSL